MLCLLLLMVIVILLVGLRWGGELKGFVIEVVGKVKAVIYHQWLR